MAQLFLIAGVAAAGVWAWWNIRSTIYQNRENRAFERSLDRHLAAPNDNATGRPPTIVNGEVVGRLVVPRLKLRAIVREGADAEVLSVALGHIPRTALPGQNGNVGVAGHRDTLFRGLRKIRKNDLIKFQTLDGDYLYRVQMTEVVAPGNIGVLKPSQYPEITLVTCYPFHYIGPAPNRFVVQARQVTYSTSALKESWK